MTTPRPALEIPLVLGRSVNNTSKSDWLMILVNQHFNPIAASSFYQRLAIQLLLAPAEEQSCDAFTGHRRAPQNITIRFLDRVAYLTSN
jgi:hypothetical protein